MGMFRTRPWHIFEEAAFLADRHIAPASVPCTKPLGRGMASSEDWLPVVNRPGMDSEWSSTVRDKCRGFDSLHHTIFTFQAPDKKSLVWGHEPEELPAFWSLKQADDYKVWSESDKS